MCLRGFSQRPGRQRLLHEHCVCNVVVLAAVRERELETGVEAKERFRHVLCQNPRLALVVGGWVGW